MKKQLLATIISAAALAAADARLGESASQCDERYGEPTGELPARLKLSDNAKAVRYFVESLEIEVTVEFRSGKAWMVTYAAKHLGKAKAKELLTEVAPGVKWGEDEFLGTDHFHAEDDSVHAIYYSSPEVKLVLLDKAAQVAEYHPPVRIADRAEAPGEGEGTADAETEGDAGEGDQGDEPRSAFDGL